MAATSPSSDQPRIDEEASRWIVRSDERPLDEREQREFDAWRAADPRHERTFAAMRRTWGEIPALAHLADLVHIERQAQGSSSRRPYSHRIASAMTVFSAVAAALIAVIFLPVLWVPTGPDYTTPVAQSRLIALPDGSQVTLGPKSSLYVDYSTSERRVQLSGEAFFEVVHDAARPFLVEAGSALVRDVGTKFDVNATVDTVRIAVLEGAVEVAAKPESTKTSAKPRLLRSGEHVEIALATAIPLSDANAPASVSAASLAAPPGAWREGRFSYDNVRLGDVIADVNRYYAPGATLDQPGLGNLRLTAAFKTSEIPAFIATLDRVLPVRTRRQADGTVRIQAENS